MPPRLLHVALLAEAYITLCVARVAILVPFHLLGRHIGTLHPPGDPAITDSAVAARATAVARSIQRAAQGLPFPANCFTRSLAGWAMLRRRGVESRLHFGIVPPVAAGRPTPHAWLDCGEVKVAGYPEALQCTELGYYARISERQPG